MGLKKIISKIVARLAGISVSDVDMTETLFNHGLSTEDMEELQETISLVFDVDVEIYGDITLGELINAVKNEIE